jgi:hypothetical protein
VERIVDPECPNEALVLIKGAVAERSAGELLIGDDRAQVPQVAAEARQEVL